MPRARLQLKALKELPEIAESETFLEDWARDCEEAAHDFFAQNLTALECEDRAKKAGYRSHRIAMEHGERTRLVLRRFIEEPAFAKLWKILKESDQEYQGFSYSSANGGFPMRAMGALEDWYKAPKFTVAERRSHDKKIEKACDALLDLLEPVALSVTVDNRFTAFSRLDEPRYTALFGWFNSPKKWEKKYDYEKRGRAVFNLTQSGITPIWAIGYIKAMAKAEVGYAGLPTKVHAKGAQKAFLIQRLWAALEHSTFLPVSLEKLVPQSLFAEIVGLVADCDCSPDDVRKALKR